MLCVECWCVVGEMHPEINNAGRVSGLCDCCRNLASLPTNHQPTHNKQQLDCENKGVTQMHHTNHTCLAWSGSVVVVSPHPNPTSDAHKPQQKNNKKKPGKLCSLQANGENPPRMQTRKQWIPLNLWLSSHQNASKSKNQKKTRKLSTSKARIEM